MVLTLVAGFVLSAPLQKPYVFEKTSSPSKRWGIAHAANAKGGDINQLVRLKDMHVVATLKGFSGFRNENHGGMDVLFSRAEDFAAVMQDGKWEPRALALVATANGAQIDMLRRVQADAMGHYRGKPYQFVYDVQGARFVGHRVAFAMLGEVPKSENAPIDYVAVSYGFTLAKSGVRLTKPSFKPLTEKTIYDWSWPTRK